MAPMSESALKRKVISAAKELRTRDGLPLHWLKIHGNAFQRTGEPDLILCVGGQFVAIELKVGDNKPTRLQLHRLEQWRSAGALTLVCYSLNQFREFIESIKTG
jgi:hypothetical protein